MFVCEDVMGLAGKVVVPQGDIFKDAGSQQSSLVPSVYQMHAQEQ